MMLHGKGRRLTTSRSERLLGSYGYDNGHETEANDDSELVEEDVWSTMEDTQMNNSHEGWSPRAVAESDESLSFNNRGRIPRDRNHVGGLSLAFEDSAAKTASSRIVQQLRNGGRDSMAAAAPSQTQRHVATSVPVNVPDWSKILRVDSIDSLHGLEDEEDHDTEMLPPHEYLAREYARSRKMVGPSVFEGVGRTLKGRDMRRVRDAVWRQTGFDG